MKHLIISLVLLVSFSSFGQFPIKKDELRSYCAKYDSTADRNFNISPDNEWTLQTDYIGDSLFIKIFPGFDTLNKITVLSLFWENNSYVNIFDSYLKLFHNTWSENLDTVFIALANTELNSQASLLEYFAIDISTITGVGINNPSNNFPTQRVKALNKPNPFRSSTFIQYTIPQSNYVAINIYNNQGRLLRVLKQKYQKAGTYSVKWDGKDNGGNRMANGEYYYQIISGDLITTKKMIFLK